MKKLFAKEIYKAEQFTEDFTPDGVMVADDVFIQNVLVPSVREKLKDKKMYLYKLPKPNSEDENTVRYFNVPFAFDWIKHGDYVVTSNTGYSIAVNKSKFEQDYKEIQLIKK